MDVPQKRFFAQYVDNVEDVREISGTSRFVSGGIGGITSQLSECPFAVTRGVLLTLRIGIYPIETLKTQMMSSTEGKNRTLASAAKRVWALGGLNAYYRGLGVRHCFHSPRSSRSLVIGRSGWRIPARVAAFQGMPRSLTSFSDTLPST